MNYAAAVLDGNPVYLDDETQGGVIAPPMYAVSLTWPLIANIWNHIDAEGFQKEVMMKMVHYTEHIEFIRPVRPGDDLTIAGRIAAILPHRAGTHIVLRLTANDSQGNAVFIEHMGGMLRGVRCIDDGTGLESIPLISRHESPCNSWEKEIDIHPLAAHIYDGCTGIHFPIHTSPAFARSVGLPGIILQGTATLAIAARELISIEAGGDPAMLKELSCRFTGMVMPGSKIRVCLVGKNGSELFFEVLDENGQKALSSGCIKLTGVK